MARVSFLGGCLAEPRCWSKGVQAGEDAGVPVDEGAVDVRRIAGRR